MKKNELRFRICTKWKMSRREIGKPFFAQIQKGASLNTLLMCLSNLMVKTFISLREMGGKKKIWSDSFPNFTLMIDKF